VAKSEVSRRLKKLDQELSRVSGGLKPATRKAKARRARSVVDALDGATKPETGRPVFNNSTNEAMNHGGLPGYLVSGFQPPSRLLRRERRIQRNKAIVMCLFVLLVLFLVARRFFM
jgi:hypothetical protein